MCGNLYFLAPLLDRMTSRFTPQRFTAQEAVDFLEESVAELPETSLQGTKWIISSMISTTDGNVFYARLSRNRSFIRSPHSPSQSKVFRGFVHSTYCAFLLVGSMVLGYSYAVVGSSSSFSAWTLPKRKTIIPQHDQMLDFTGRDQMFIHRKL